MLKLRSSYALRKADLPITLPGSYLRFPLAGSLEQVKRNLTDQDFLKEKHCQWKNCSYE